MQLLAKFKKILYMEFRATLNFRKFLGENLLDAGAVENGILENELSTLDS